MNTTVDRPNIKVAVIQMISTPTVAENLTTAYHLLAEAAQNNAAWAVLPEYWPLIGHNENDKLTIAEDFGHGLLQDKLKQWSQELKLTIFAGTIPLRSRQDNKIFNSMLVYQNDGSCVYRYDKIHLFSYCYRNEQFNESATIVPGNQIPQLSLNGYRLGLGICYDLRFPELFRAQSEHEIMILPAAFTHTTGLAHWQILLQARAIENQCYVLASGQGGRHPNGRKTFGHSMIINPWGKIEQLIEYGNGVIYADIDRAKIETTRAKLPALKHRIY